MFRKFAVLCLAMTVMASTAQASVIGLKTAFDEMSYALQVEWDQKDEAFKRQQIEKFNIEVKKLQAQGLTNSELIEFSLEQMTDVKARKEIRTALSMIQINQMNQHDAQKYIKDALERSLNQGASWNGYILINLAVLIVVIAIISGGSSSSGEPAPVGEQPDGSYCDWGTYCGWEWDWFTETQRYQCNSFYYCVP